jgi:hypothetical protein
MYGVVFVVINVFVGVETSVRISFGILALLEGLPGKVVILVEVVVLTGVFVVETTSVEVGLVVGVVELAGAVAVETGNVVGVFVVGSAVSSLLFAVIALGGSFRHKSEENQNKNTMITYATKSMKLLIETTKPN